MTEELFKDLNIRLNSLDLETYKKEEEKKIKNDYKKLKKLKPEEVASLFEKSEIDDDEEEKKHEIEKLQEAVKIIKGENEEVKKWSKNKIKRLRSENKRISEIFDRLGEENTDFITRLRAYWHVMPFEYHHIIEELRHSPLSDYLKYYGEYGYDKKSYEEKVEKMTDEEIKDLKSKIEMARDLLERPLLALKKEKEIQKLNKSEKKNYQDVESEMEPGSALWHVDRREQKIPKK